MTERARTQEKGKRGDARQARALQQRLPRRVFLLVLFVAICELVTVAILEAQAGLTTFVRAEGNWSRAQSQAVRALSQYIDHGDLAELEKVHAAMRVTEGNKIARDACDAVPADMPRAYEGAYMANYREDVPRLLTTYRIGRDLPYFRDAVVQWKTAEPLVLRIGEMAGEVARLRQQKKLTGADRQKYLDELNAIDAQVQPMEVEFSRKLAQGGDVLRWVLLGFATATFFALAWYVTWVMRRTLRQVRDSEVEFQRAFHQASVGMLKIEARGHFTRANEAVARILGRPLSSLRHVRLQEVMHAEDLNLDADGKLDFDGLAEPGERRLLGRDGVARWVRWTASPVGGADGGQLFVMLEDISDAHELQREIAHQATHDELTGLINRREIGRRLEHALADLPGGGKTHVFCFLDLDQFKLVNDTCGHAAGDRFLVQFGDMVSMRLRDGDWVGRLGGDEFAVLLQDIALEDGEQAMARIHDALGRSVFHWDGRTFPLNCSIGLVEVNSASADVEWVLHAADAACYLAKEEGRNRVRSYRDSDETLSRRRSELEWVTSAQSAIGERRLLLYAQRIEPLPDPGSSGLRYEVLARLRDRDGEIHTPGKFLAAMERFGQAAVVDRYVLDAVLGQLRSDPAHLNRLQACHINVSAQSIADPSFRAHVASQLDAVPNVARKLCFEITETAMISNMADARRFIDAVRQRGCRIALDDFGTGLSSFGYLKSLPVDIVKIDSVFVADLADNEADLVLVRSMSQIARALGKLTIAEGIESELVARQLAGIGIDYAQGFAIHRPVPFEELIATLHTRSNNTGTAA